jgi:hypothetical protein
MNTAPIIHAIEIPRIGKIRVQIVFTDEMIFTRIDRPPALDRAARKERRLAQRWITKAMRPLDADPRPMLCQSFTEGRPSAVGFENGKGRVCGISNLPIQ